MKRILIAWLMALTAVSESGCGTICNFAGGVTHPETEPRVYGGVQRDIDVIEGFSKKPLFGNSVPQPRQSDGGAGAALVVGFCLGMIIADPVLSFVADTLTLPITLYVQHRREAAYNTGSENANPADAAGPESPSIPLGGADSSSAESSH